MLEKLVVYQLFSIYLKKKSVVILMINTIISTNDIDENNQQHLLKEIKRITKERNKYNIHDIPSPKHIKRNDYDDNKTYKKTKELYYISYKNTYNDLDKEITRLQNLNTKLCIEIKEEEDEEALQLKNKLKTESRKYHNNKYYEQNKLNIKQQSMVNKIKKLKNEIDSIDCTNIHHLVKSTEIIKPMCLCCRRCDVINYTTLKKHSMSLKHKLFKTIIKLIHYKRQKNRLKHVIKNINNELIEFKKNIRIRKENNRSAVIVNKTDREIVEYYNDLVDDVDENILKLREPYIDKVEYSKKYKKNILLLSIRKINIKKVNH